VTSCADAVRTFGFLTSGVHTYSRTCKDCAGINGELAIADGHCEPIHATGRWATLLFANTVVLRTVTLAFKPLRALAFWNTASEVWTLLVQRNDACLHSGKHWCLRAVDSLCLAD
jgi:hypothetical protein